ncbi:MAG: hypothetical protein GX079_00655 [Tissierellia bacterium]|nr:hypothetical protein [Tissierellia bacterium]
MLLSNKERRDIGLDYVFEKLQIMTPYGEKRQNLKKLYRPGEEEELKAELEAILLFTEELSNKAYPLHQVQYEFCRVKDISASINRANRGAILDEVELFEIKGFSRVVSELDKKLSGLRLPPAFELVNLDHVEELLDPDRSGLLTFYIYDSYSEELTRLREEKKILEEEIFRASLDKREELLGKRGQLVLLEEEEERRIRKDLSQKIGSEAKSFFINMEAIGRLDHWIAKAKLARDYRFCRPELSLDMLVELEGASIPMVEDLLKRSMVVFQPLSISLKPGTTLVTGANMGGKSVSLKTLVLNVLLVHLGFLPFASKMKLSLMDFVFYMGDDQEDLRSGLSSFGAEVIKLRDILKRTKIEKGLIVLDEPARGTNPKEGRAIVKGLAQQFLEKDSILLLATHFDQVVEPGMVHYQIRGLEGVDFEKLKEGFEFKEEKSLDLLRSKMDYRLERVEGDREVPKDALRICRLLGLDRELIEIINQLL